MAEDDILNIPYITEEKIEKLTSDILQTAYKKGVYQNKETPVELMAEMLELKYLYEDLEKDFGKGTLGSMDFSSNTIFLNQRHFGETECNLGLLNFTIAHEIGHFILHKEIYENSAEKIALLHKREIKNYEKALKRIEYQANLFAGELLMPKTLFKEEWRKLKGTNYFDKRKIMCDFFQVSKRALEVRLEHLKLC
jgi:Zn-dependent peptidase ImmA (M78 family)